MKVAIITDQHFGARSDSQIFISYFKKFYDDVCLPYLIENNIDTVIDMGDTFDRRKYINYVSLASAKEMWFDPLKKQGIKLHTIVGNHTAYFKNTNKVNSMNLLVEDYPNITVYPNPETMKLSDGTEICMIPWINSENYADTMDTIKKTRADICLGHLEISGFRMYKGSITGGNLEQKIFDKFEMTCSGHYHHKSSQRNIHYLGNPYGITWADYDDPRGFHILDTEDMTLEFIRNPYEIFHKVWYDDAEKSIDQVLDLDFTKYKGNYVKVIVSSKTNPFFFDKFLDELYAADAQHIQIVDDHNNVEDLSTEDIMNDVDDTLTVLQKTVAAMPIDSNRKELDKLIIDLYTESLTMEIV